MTGTSRSADRWTAVGVGAVVLFAILAFGATERWARSGFEVGAFALGALRCWAWRERLPRFPAAAAGAGALALASGIQSWSGAGEDAFLSLTQSLTWAACAVLAVVSADILASRDLRRSFRKGALAAGASLAVLGLLQYFTARDRLYWVFPARSGAAFTPFVNPDHFAILMELLLPLALWEGLRERGRRLAGLGCAALFYAAVIASGSRAGALMATGEVVLVPPLAHWIERRRAGPLAPRLALLAIFAAAASVAVGWESLLTRFSQHDPLRYRRETYQASLALVRERPWTGFGAGTFEIVYPSQALFDIGQRVDHAHNDWLEWAVEGGVPLTLAVAAAWLWPLRRGRRRPWAWGAWVVLLHALVDFPMQIPGLAALVVVWLAAADAG